MLDEQARNYDHYCIGVGFVPGGRRAILGPSTRIHGIAINATYTWHRHKRHKSGPPLHGTMSASGQDHQNGLGGGEVPNPIGLTGEGSLRIYKLLRERSAGKGILINQDNEVVGKPAPATGYHGEYPELRFDKPHDSIMLSRVFLVEGKPDGEKVKSLIKAACVSELNAIGIQANPKNCDDMFEFHNELLRSVRGSLRSKLSVVLDAAISDQGILWEAKNRMCKEKADVVRKYKQDNPKQEDFPKYYGAFVLPFEDGTEIDTAVYNMMMEFEIWHATGERYDLLTYTAEDSKRIKASCFRAIGRSVVRQFRHEFTQEKKLPHGVCFNLTVPGGRKNERRVTQQFDFSCVKYWGGAKHKKYCQDRKLPAPQPLGSNELAV